MGRHLGGQRGKLIAPQQRQMAIESISTAMDSGASQYKACEVIGIDSRTLQHWQKSGLTDRRQTVEKTPGNKLSEAERTHILEVCNSPAFANLSPKQIVPILADQGDYLASESSLYRILRAAKQNTRRGRVANPVARTRPRAYIAEQANQIWSWDITYLPTTVKGLFFYLYLMMDIYSRKIVGWEVYAVESDSLASEVLSKARLAEKLSPDHPLVLHSDNGHPMKGATMVATMTRLGVIPSFSRPSVSNDNPYSESLFKTLKYVPLYPDKPFADLAAARNWVMGFASWYNTVHRHSGIKYVTPEQRHRGEDIAMLEQRHQVYEAAKACHPERWARETRNWQHEAQVRLNPVNKDADKATKAEGN